MSAILAQHNETPDGILEDLKKELTESQLEDKLKSERIGALEKRNDEGKKIVDDYSKALQGLMEQRLDFSQYYVSKEKMITNVVPENTREAIEHRISKVDKEIKTAKEKVRTSRDRVREARKSVSASSEEHEKRVAVFEVLKNFQKAVENGFKELEALRKEIEELDTGTNNRVMYFLITDLFKRAWTKDLIDDPDVRGRCEAIESLKDLDKVDKAKLSSLVVQAFKDLNAAKEALDEHQKEFKLAQQALTAAKEERDELKANRWKKIVDLIEKMDPPDADASSDNPEDTEEGAR